MYFYHTTNNSIYVLLNYFYLFLLFYAIYLHYILARSKPIKRVSKIRGNFYRFVIVFIGSTQRLKCFDQVLKIYVRNALKLFSGSLELFHSTCTAHCIDIHIYSLKTCLVCMCHKFETRSGPDVHIQPAFGEQIHFSFSLFPKRDTRFHQSFFDVLSLISPARPSSCSTTLLENNISTNVTFTFLKD